jgi:hypothetical protein
MRGRPWVLPLAVPILLGEFAFAGPRTPDLSDIMAHLADAIAFIRVSQRSLNYLDVAYDEESFLRKGLAALDAIYTEIDFASIALSKQRQN